jgi:hypothetical protein
MAVLWDCKRGADSGSGCCYQGVAASCSSAGAVELGSLGSALRAGAAARAVPQEHMVSELWRRCPSLHWPHQCQVILAPTRCRSGNVHGAFDNDLETLAAVRQLMGFLPLNNVQRWAPAAAAGGLCLLLVQAKHSH